MSIKTKFHLTLVVLITILNTVIGISVSDTANALIVNNKVDFKNSTLYNLTSAAGGNIYNIYNNINIKYISLKLSLVTEYNSSHIQKISTKTVLSFKDKIEILNENF
jgi:hypothetical protein